MEYPSLTNLAKRMDRVEKFAAYSFVKDFLASRQKFIESAKSDEERKPLEEQKAKLVLWLCDVESMGLSYAMKIAE